MKTKLKIPERKSIHKNIVNWRTRSLRTKIFIVLLSIIALASLLVLLLPYIPRWRYLIFKPKINAVPYQQAAQNTKKKDSVTALPQEVKKGNRLVLPQIGVNAEIIDGRDIYVIGKNQGVWRESSDIDPTKAGNIVIAGHRFLYTSTNGGYFYNLPEIKNGDKIYIQWSNKVFEYQVYNTRTVLPTQVDIRDSDPKVPKKLTMYTCYPLGSTAKRFVIEAKQI